MTHIKAPKKTLKTRYNRRSGITTVSTSLPNEFVIMLDRQVTEAGTTRSDIIRLMIIKALAAKYGEPAP